MGEKSNEFFDLKAGDKVAISSRSSTRSWTIGTVEKVGKIHFTIVGSTSKFRVDGGRRVGDSTWHSAYAYRMTDEIKKQIAESVAAQKESRMRYECRDFDWRDADIEIIKAVHAIIAKAKDVQP